MICGKIQCWSIMYILDSYCVCNCVVIHLGNTVKNVLIVNNKQKFYCPTLNNTTYYKEFEKVGLVIILTIVNYEKHKINHEGLSGVWEL